MSLISDLALILIVAAFVTIVFKKLKQPLVLGYIVAGFIVSPHMPYTMSVLDKANIQTWADIGVIFLLFSLGLEFSVKKILKMGISPIISSLIIVFSMGNLGFIAGRFFGWAEMDCIFLAGMIAISSSTTIIYKAFTDMGITQNKFATVVMSVLILEDILSIIMMVMLSTIAAGDSLSGGQIINSVMKIGFFIVLWFVIGLFAIPLILRSVRQHLNNETLLIVALGLCCFMAVVSTEVGFSAAFGAFVMGSILAETIEAERIERLVEPVKNLFGAIFFVSVGMLVDPHILVKYALPILLLTLTVLLGQAIFGTLGYFLSGQPLKTAMRCSFSMAQVGEFAFIIASLGQSLHVIGDFLYPVMVAVSVVTTFLTPYMIRAAEPAYSTLTRILPKHWVRRLEHIQAAPPYNPINENYWRSLVRAMIANTIVYGILSAAVIALMFSVVLPICRQLSVEWIGTHWLGNAVCGVATLALISPFLRSIVMKKNHSEAFRTLWTRNRLNRLPLLGTIVIRGFVAMGFVFYVINYLSRFRDALIIAAALGFLALVVISRTLKDRSISLERLFVQNLRSRDIQAQMRGERKPLFATDLLDRDIHMSTIEVPEASAWAGKSLRSLELRTRFGVHVSSILRGSRRINIPGGSTIIFPNDRIEVIGDDEQLTKFSSAAQHELVKEDVEIEKREMKLRQIVLTASSPLVGKSIQESGIRENYNCMVVGIEQGQQKLTLINPYATLAVDDVLWIVGEEKNLKKIVSS